MGFSGYLAQNLIFGHFLKKSSGSYLGFKKKIQENRVLYCKIDFFGKTDKIGYTSVKTYICHFCEEKTSKMGFRPLVLKWHN